MRSDGFRRLVRRARGGFDTARLRSEGWDAFAAPGAPALDFVFTLCGAAAQPTP